MKITYEDKETKINNESIPIKNKITAENMNEIKNTVNANDDEVKQIKAILPTTTGTGTNVTLTNTAEMEFVKSPIPSGNITQDGTPSPDSEVEVETVTGDVEINITNGDNTQSQTYPLTLGNIELCKIGDYQDYIYKENGKWYIHKEIGKYIFNGSENWTSWGAVSGSSNTMSQAGMAMTFINRAGMSNMFEVKADYSATEHIVIAGGLTMLYVQINNSRLSTVDLEGFKNWLSENNVIFYGIPTTETDTEITDTTLISQLEDILNATSYEGQTNINGTSTKANPIFNVEAYQSIRLVLAG